MYNLIGASKSQDNILISRIQEQEEIWRNHPQARVDIQLSENIREVRVCSLHSIISPTNFEELLINSVTDEVLLNALNNPKNFAFRAFRRTLKTVFRHRNIGISTLEDIIKPNISLLGAEYDPLYCEDPLLPVSVGNPNVSMSYFVPVYPEIRPITEDLDGEDKQYYKELNDIYEADPFEYTTAFSGLIIYNSRGIENQRYYGLAQVDGNNVLADRVVGLIIVEWIGIDKRLAKIPTKLSRYYSKLES